MNADTESAPESLDAWHEQRDARWCDVAGRRTVASYGDDVGEMAALRDGCGLVERRWRERLVVSGEDRRRFLNGYLTCDIAALEPGEGAYGFFTSAQGRILADAVVGAAEDELRVDVPAPRRRDLAEHLGRFVLADRVELSLPATPTQWVLAGPAAPDLLAETVGSVPPGSWSRSEGSSPTGAVEVVRERDLGVPVFSLHVAGTEAPGLADALIAAGAVAVGLEAFESLRIEAGVPRYGADFDDGNFPQETGLEGAVSYSKGCYLGQEVVARIHYRGHVNHQLRALAIDAAAAPSAGGEIRLDGEVVGTLGSVAFSRRAGGPIGLAVLHRKAAAIGTLVTLDGELPMRVEEPGFALAAAAES